MNSFAKSILFASGLLVAGSGLNAQTTPTNPNENASDRAKAVLKLLQDFKVKREQFIADRKALIEKLKTATEAEKKQILDELRAEQQNRIDAQRELAKALRDAAKQQRDDRKKGGG